MEAQDFAGQEPRLLPEEYFAGRTRVWGMFLDRFGNLRRQFTADMDGTWDGEELTLVESFVYSDGETERREWHIRKTGEHTYEGRAGDVIGVAEGEAYGNAFNLNYKLALKMKDSTRTVHFDDWLFLQNEEVLINRAEVSKFGITVGQVIAFFRKLPSPTAH